MINSQKKELIKSIPFLDIVICIIFLIVSFIIQDFPSNPTYTYINNCIVTHSWHDIYSIVLAIVFSEIDGDFDKHLKSIDSNLFKEYVKRFKTEKGILLERVLYGIVAQK